jgi:chitinase
MDVSYSSRDSGAPIWQEECNGTDAQKWDVIPDGAGFYSFKARVSGKCAEVMDAQKNRGMMIWQQDCRPASDQQKFKFTLEKDDIYRVTIKHSNLCLDVFQALRNSQVPILQWDCHGMDHQKWRFEPR